MYAINKWRVSMPVFGLIDEAAEKAGFVPLKGKVTAPTRIQTDQEKEKAEARKLVEPIEVPATGQTSAA
jgi:hypothetical protein